MEMEKGGTTQYVLLVASLMWSLAGNNSREQGLRMRLKWMRFFQFGRPCEKRL